MGLHSIWNQDGDFLKKNSKGFSARSTGCSCCSTQLETEEEVKKEAVESLMYIMKACVYFDWDLGELAKLAAKQDKEMRSKK